MRFLQIRRRFVENKLKILRENTAFLPASRTIFTLKYSKFNEKLNYFSFVSGITKLRARNQGVSGASVLVIGWIGPLIRRENKV
jgi:hypothetical protein